MAIFAAIFTFLGRQVQRILSTLLGWASTLLFGRVPKDRQMILVGITFGSIAWVALLAGVLVPDVGTFLLGFVPVPDMVPDWVVRLVMLVAALALPPILGAATIFLMPDADRPHGGALAVQVLRGYPLAAALAVALVALAVIAVWYKVRAITRRRSTEHIPLIVRPGGYEETVERIEHALDDADLRTTSGPAPAPLALPARLLGKVAGRGIGSLVPDRLARISAADLEVIAYPTDIAIEGTKRTLARARAAIATRLTAAPAYVTTTAEPQAVEDRIKAIADGSRDGTLTAEDVARELDAIDATLATIEIPHDEWEVLYRLRLQTERDLLRGDVVGEEAPAVGRGAAPARTRVALHGRTAAGADEPQPADRLVGALGIAALVVDVALLVWQRLAPPRSR